MLINIYSKKKSVFIKDFVKKKRPYEGKEYECDFNDVIQHFHDCETMQRIEQEWNSIHVDIKIITIFEDVSIPDVKLYSDDGIIAQIRKDTQIREIINEDDTIEVRLGDYPIYPEQTQT